MRKLIFFLILFLPLVANAQSRLVVVKLKNGTELKGYIKSMDPMDSMILDIAGMETTIRMENVLKVEEQASNSNVVSEASQPQLNIDDKLVVTDNADYPESIDLKIGNETIKMILVRGGDLNMGFDGRGSRSMNSEPVHKVGVTSFYISETFVTSSIVSEVSEKSSRKDYYKTTWKKANEIVQGIASKVGLPVRLPFEAEWEYAACSREQEKIFDKCQDVEYCYDLYDEYRDTEYRIDPKGPTKDKQGFHVFRAYSQEKGKLSRSGGLYERYFRIAIKAKDISEDKAFKDKITIK